MQILRRSTATTIAVGPVLDISGFPVSAAVLADFGILKNGVLSTLIPPSVATYIHNGYYTISLTEENTDTVGHLTFTTNNANYAMPLSKFQIVERSVFDTYYSQNAPAGVGAWTVTVKTILSSVALEGATVRVTRGAESRTGKTNAQGEILFNLDSGVYQVSITGNGFTFNGASLTVDSDLTTIYTLTPILTVASDPDKVTGYWTCLDHLGERESGVVVYVQLHNLPNNSSGFVLDNAIRSASSGVDGVARFENLLPGCGYYVWRGSGEKFYVTIPNVQGSVELKSLIGIDEEAQNE